MRLVAACCFSAESQLRVSRVASTFVYFFSRPLIYREGGRALNQQQGHEDESWIKEHYWFGQPPERTLLSCAYDQVEVSFFLTRRFKSYGINVRVGLCLPDQDPVMRTLKYQMSRSFSTLGMRVDPPTRTTSSTSGISRPASFMALSTGPKVFLNRSMLSCAMVHRGHERAGSGKVV